MNRIRHTLAVTLPIVVVVVLTLAFLYVATGILDLFALWKFYRGWVDTFSNLTGINGYLITASALVAFVPFYYGVTLLLYHPLDRAKRWRGIGILLVMAVLYNVSLYVVTKDTSFAFAGGTSHRYYAITPAGVHFFDRPGMDPAYGIPLKPVTSENVRELELLSTGKFVEANPISSRFFNPITGAPELWYYKTEQGTFEFYTKPGFHPGTGQRLLAVTTEIYLEWKRAYDAEVKRRELEDKRIRDEAEKKREAEAKRRAELEAAAMRRGVAVPYYGGLSHAGMIITPYAVPGGDRR